uniref:Uncharacterized protein n=1 Tax=Glossina brevipalpis TaxID=37001 RepID=A0A1A9WNZ3_9MUSC
MNGLVIAFTSTSALEIRHYFSLYLNNHYLKLLKFLNKSHEEFKLRGIIGVDLKVDLCVPLSTSFKNDMLSATSHIKDINL